MGVYRYGGTVRALIASGSGRYGDPWHPFPETSVLVARILTEADFDTTVDDDVDRAMRRLAGVDLLVVNAGDPWRGAEGDEADAPPPDSLAGLVAALDRGIGVLALHSAVSSLRDYPDWAVAVGATWVPGASHHPPIGTTQVTASCLPDGESIEDFSVFDERYSRLQRLGQRTLVAMHAGSSEPAAWVRTTGTARIAVDVLGHDARSFESAGHRTLVRQLARWAAGQD